MSHSKNLDTLAESFRSLIASTGEDASREGLRDTPERAAKAFHFLTQGYHMDIDALVNGALFTCDNEDMVVVKNIEFYSMCEHHLLPFWGQCHVAYLPSGRIIGLSKIPSIVNAFARRLQVQETMTRQIANTLQQVTGGWGVSVIITAQHMCSMMRGVQQPNTALTTSARLGAFEKPEVQKEFYRLLSGPA